VKNPMIATDLSVLLCGIVYVGGCLQKVEGITRSAVDAPSQLAEIFATGLCEIAQSDRSRSPAQSRFRDPKHQIDLSGS